MDDNRSHACSSIEQGNGNTAMRSRILISTALAGSLLVSGCANNGSDDMTGALLIGAAVIGLGVLAATSSSNDDDDDNYHRRRYGSSGYERHHDRRDYDDRRYAHNGRCDDPRYRTSNGGRAEPGSDERDCRRYGDGRK